MFKSAGPLVIIGGAEDKKGACTVLREFVRLAGGEQARIVIMTVATKLTQEVGDAIVAYLQRLGRDIQQAPPAPPPTALVSTTGGQP